MRRRLGAESERGSERVYGRFAGICCASAEDGLVDVHIGDTTEREQARRVSPCVMNIGQAGGPDVRRAAVGGIAQHGPPQGLANVVGWYGEVGVLSKTFLLKLLFRACRYSFLAESATLASRVVVSRSVNAGMVVVLTMKTTCGYCALTVSRQ